MLRIPVGDDESSRPQTWHQHNLQTCYVRGLYIACLDERSEPKISLQHVSFARNFSYLKKRCFLWEPNFNTSSPNFRVTLASLLSGSYVEVIRIAWKLRRRYTFSNLS